MPPTSAPSPPPSSTTASLAWTMRYAHLAPEHLRVAVSRLDGLTSDAIPAEVTADRAQGRAHEPVTAPLVVSKSA